MEAEHKETEVEKPQQLGTQQIAHVSLAAISDTSKEHQSGDEIPSAIYDPPNFKPGWRLVVALSSLSVITLMAALDATSLSVALPVISKALNGTAIEAFWAGTSFLLTQTIGQPVLGAFSHIFGRKPLIFVSLVFFGVGAIVAAVAGNFSVLLAGRSIQGIGGGGIIALSEIVLTDLIPLRERGKWYAFLSSMWALGTVGGPILGGGFSQNVSWTWLFWINLPMIGVAVPMLIFFLHLQSKPSSLIEKLRRVDWIGMILFGASATGFMIPLSWGGVLYDWSSWRTLVPLILCFFGLVAFVVYEEYLTRKGLEPLIRLSPIKNRTGAVTFYGTFIHGIVLWCILYYEPLYYEGVKEYTTIITGLALFPESFTVAPASIITGITVAITGKYRWGVWTGWLLTTFGVGLLAYLKVETSVAGWIFLNLPFGIGTGMLFAAMSIATQAAAKPSDSSWAVILFAFFRSLGNTFGVAVGGVVFQNQMYQRLLDIPSLASQADAYSRDATALIAVIKAMPDSAEKMLIKTAYTDALRIVYIVCCALAATALVASFFTESISLDQQLATEQGFKDTKKKASDEEAKQNSA